jgi:hypothetical protein
LGVKRTCRFAAQMVAFDTYRTLRFVGVRVPISG